MVPNSVYSSHIFFYTTAQAAPPPPIPPLLHPLHLSCIVYTALNFLWANNWISLPSAVYYLPVRTINSMIYDLPALATIWPKRCNQYSCISELYVLKPPLHSENQHLVNHFQWKNVTVCAGGGGEWTTIFPIFAKWSNTQHGSSSENAANPISGRRNAFSNRLCISVYTRTQPARQEKLKWTVGRQMEEGVIES